MLGSRRWCAVVCGGVLALGAFGIGGTAANASKSKPTVAIAKVKSVGNVLVDAKGKTLYTLTSAGNAVACSADCAAAWPPLVVASGSPKGAKGVTGLGVVSGGTQVTADGLPLYRFSGDAKAGQATGEGISSFGGIWHTVKSAGSPSTSGTKASNGGSDYGY